MKGWDITLFGLAIFILVNVWLFLAMKRDKKKEKLNT